MAAAPRPVQKRCCRPVVTPTDNVMLANALIEALVEALTQAGFAVDCMHDERAADHLLATQDYALLILDLGLPKLDGLEVLRRLRQQRNALPVLILAAHGSVEDRAKGAQSRRRRLPVQAVRPARAGSTRPRADTPQPRAREHAIAMRHAVL